MATAASTEPTALSSSTRTELCDLILSCKGKGSTLACSLASLAGVTAHQGAVMGARDHGLEALTSQLASLCKLRCPQITSQALTTPRPCTAARK